MSVRNEWHVLKFCIMVSDNNNELPFFPQYETELLHEGKLRVSWFEANFSQSHYNVQNATKGSNACTLIAVLMAAKCHQYKIQVSLIKLIILSFFYRNQKCFQKDLISISSYSKSKSNFRCIQTNWFTTWLY